ncbi:MAG: complex I subunit 1 family protein [Candidatus Omnitrophota bacterium]
MKILFNYLVFPGFLFASITGLIACWIDRKVSARIQWRQGPPWYQNFVDIVKLLGKETIVPAGASLTFLIAPLLGLVSVILVAGLLGQAIISPLEGLPADLIVVIYLLIVPALSLILGASSSRNPLASQGASREMKLVLAYELPFILSVITVIIKSGMTLEMGEILNHQINFGSNIASFSGGIAFAVAILCMQAKLGLAPFEISEAEQEIMGGVLIEYSGKPLAAFKLTKAILLYAMPVFLTVLFLGKDTSFLFLVLKYVALLVGIILIKNTNPRLRIDQALKFFWGPVTVLAGLSVISALLGR